jgi:hypothetical protein
MPVGTCVHTCSNRLEHERRIGSSSKLIEIIKFGVRHGFIGRLV